MKNVFKLKPLAYLLLGCVAGAGLVLLFLSQSPMVPLALEKMIRRDAPAAAVLSVADLKTAPPARPTLIAEDSNTAPTLPHLPPVDVPLLQQLDALKTRALAGDPQASCRLIMSVNRCSEEIRNQRVTEKMIEDLEKKKQQSDEFLINLAARYEERKASLDAYCSDIEPSELPATKDIVARSLPYLSPHQKTVLAMMRSDGNLRRLATSASFGASGRYVFPQFLAERTYEFLQAGYAAGDPLALEGLVLIHAPTNSMGPQGVGVWLPNPELFLQHAILFQRLFGGEALGRQAVQSAQLVADSLPREEAERIIRTVDQEEKRWRLVTQANPRSSTKAAKSSKSWDDALNECAE